MHDIEGIAKALDPTAKQAGNQWRLRCPVHEDKTPSAYLTLRNDQLLWHCFGCGDQDGFRRAIEATGLYTYKPPEGSAAIHRRGATRDAWLDSIKAAIREESKVAHDRTATDFLRYAEDMQPPAQYCGFIYSHSSGFIAAPGGSGKSMFTLGLAAHLAAGDDFCGWEIPAPLNVHIVDVEMSDAALAGRMRSLGVSNPRIRVDTTDQRRKVQMSHFRLGDDDDMEMLKVRAHEADVIIVDNVSACLQPIRAGDLFSPETWQQVMPLEHWARLNGKCIIFVDHTNNAGKLAGSLHKHRMADFVAILERTSLLGEPWLEFLIEVDKCRYDPEPEDLLPRLIRLEDGRWSHSDPKAFDDDIFKQVIEGNMTKTDAAIELDITRKTLDKRLKQYTIRRRSKQRMRE